MDANQIKEEFTAYMKERYGCIAKTSWHLITWAIDRKDGALGYPEKSAKRKALLTDFASWCKGKHKSSSWENCAAFFAEKGLLK